MTRQWRWIAASAAAALVVIGAAFAITNGAFRGEPPPAVGGPFRLTDTSGARVDEGVLKGKWSLVFFGFTYCPEACPTTLAALGKAMADLGPKAKDVQVVFISVDPERDTPAALKAYLASPAFPKGTIGLTGSKADVAQVAKAYHVFYQKTGAGPDYSIDHSTMIYVMDPRGRFRKLIPYGVAPDEVRRQLEDARRG